MIETKKSFCRFCHVFCGIEVDVDSERQQVLAVRGDPDNPYSRGYTCSKGRAVPEEINHPDRLRSCKKRRGDGWADIGTDQALNEIAEKLLDIRERHGARSIAVYTASGAGFSATGMPLTKAWLNAVGSPSYYTAFTIDCPSYVVAANWIFGTVRTPLGMYAGVFDIDNAEVGMFIGTNPIASHGLGLGGPFPGKRLRDARSHGMKLIVVDPRRTDMARLADLHLQVKPGEDAALLAGLINVIIERRLYDGAYVAQYVSGLEELAAAVKDFDLDYVARRTHVAADRLEQAAVMFATAKSGAARQGSGLTMSRHQNLNTYLVYAVNALCGRIDRKGGAISNPGVFSRARANDAPPVQVPLFAEGGARMRGLHGLFTGPGYVEMPTATLSDEILEPGNGQVRALLVHGGNPVTAFPDQEKTVRALKALDLLVVVDPVMSATAQFAHYVIAPKHFLERPDATTLLDASLPIPFAQFTPAVVRGPDSLLEEWEVGWELAKRMGLPLNLPGIGMERKPSSDDVIAVLSRRGRISLEEVRQYPSGHVFGDLAVGAVLPHAIAHPDKKMAAGHPDAMAELREVRAESIAADGSYEARDAFSHRLIAIRMPDFHNSKGQRLTKLRTKHPYNPAYMNPADLEKLGIDDGQLVVIDSGRGRVKAPVKASADVMAGVVAMAHGWGTAPEDEGDVRQTGSPTARLIPDDLLYDRLTGMPLLSALPVNVRAA
ncbi:MAG: molybdopterin-dependent oxidoreductase [Candidatus Binatia bacterium]